MTAQEFNDWMTTCPTHKWERLSDEDGYIHVSFLVIDDEKDEDL